ncbi:MAG: hypothetical protein A2231_11150 [Candidatus Firestonebacteria bacterium RIFOXYA2_FULL_40_8]|nr:MAG: hypothetical protein A2231_11150 [Candidatus Firestonebacteria bacterium RIFOXYA2_FULL_40_8]
MDNIIDVLTGEVKTGRDKKILVSSAIGSCVAVVAIDVKKKVGGMAHIMLPGKAPAEKSFKTRYAFNALAGLFSKMRKLGAVKNNIKVFIAGGANVLRLKNCNVGRDNIKSIKGILKDREINILAKNTGGIERRRVKLDISNKTLYYSKGEGKNRILWKG